MKTNLCNRFHQFFRIFTFLAVCTPLHATPGRDLILTESEWVGPNIIRVPFTLTGTIITVRGSIDSIEGNFFFDTGASGLLLNYRYFGNPARAASKEGGGDTGKVRVLGAEKVDTALPKRIH